MTTLKQVLKNKLTKKELELLPRSFDTIGNIVIFSEFPNELIKKQKLIGETLIKLNKNIHTVLKKTSMTSGIYRTRKLTLIAGKKNTETLHKEHGFVLRLDPKKTYFSPRESTERLRIENQVKPKEEILVMFSGISPLPIMIAKNKPQTKTHAIEINPLAHKYASGNIKLNKVFDKIKVYQGDVKKILPKINKKFDRIIMPLPKDAYKFLDLVFRYIKKKGIINLYFFSKEDSYKDMEKIVENTAKKSNKKIRILNKKKVLPYSPKVWKIVFDIKITS